MDAKDIDEKVHRFLKDANLFLAPDPEIMNYHGVEPRTPAEEAALAVESDPGRLEIVRERILAGLNESFEMLENTGAAPGAKWGDCVAAVFTASGDLTLASTGGVVIFSNLVQYPLKFINKYWTGEPTVGVREGDAFLVNDAHYGQAHNTDQSLMMPVFWKGQHVCWAGATVHEGENGAIEPGGMPGFAEQVWDEGLRMSPFKVVENYQLRRDIVTFLQNSVREPKLQLGDMKVKLFVCRRIERRIHEAIEEYGVEAVVACLRGNLEDTEAEVRRRLKEWPDGTVRHSWFIDNTLRENVMIKINLTLTKKGDELIFDYRGSSPEFTNRANNTLEITLKGMLSQVFLTFVWPDLPRNQAVLAPMTFVCDEPSIIKPSPLSPQSQCIQSVFHGFSVGQTAVMKFLFSNPFKYTRVVAPWYCMNNVFLFGGLTQHGEMVGNVCADINGMGGGARSDRDGENGIAPIFATMADLGEQELIEEEMPFIQLVSKKMMKDNQAFGQFRGGMGYQMMVAMRDSPAFGFMLCAVGSKFPNVPGLFGGYGCPTYPLARVSGVDVFEVFKTNPGSFRYDIAEIMNEQPLEGGTYWTMPMALKYDLAKRGELYMIAQGSGGGFGDPLEREPELVLKDLDDDLISDDVAWRMYRLVYDIETRVLDRAATEKARDEERKARMGRGKPFKAFAKEWVTDDPPADLPYYGSWGDPAFVYAGSPDQRYPAGKNPPIIMPNPLEVRIKALEAEVARLKGSANGRA